MQRAKPGWSTSRASSLSALWLPDFVTTYTEEASYLSIIAGNAA